MRRAVDVLEAFCLFSDARGELQSISVSATSELLTLLDSIDLEALQGPAVADQKTLLVDSDGSKVLRGLMRNPSLVEEFMVCQGLGDSLLISGLDGLQILKLLILIIDSVDQNLSLSDFEGSLRSSDPLSILNLAWSGFGSLLSIVLPKISHLSPRGKSKAVVVSRPDERRSELSTRAHAVTSASFTD